jgi:hypothetical protein
MQFVFCMMTETLSLSASVYRCEPCSLQQGTEVAELVRMIPLGMVINGKIVGPEYYCCPVCYEPKFDARTKRKIGHGKRKKRDGTGGSGSSRGPRLVT